MPRAAPDQGAEPVADGVSTQAMRLEEGGGVSALGWVKPQIDQLLSEARQGLEVYAEAPDDRGVMQGCVDLLHQVLGTLRMVELYGTAELAREMELLARSLLDGAVGDRDEALGALMRSLVQLPDYLDLVASGNKDIPIVLLPLLNELRKARGGDPADPQALFHPDLERPLPADAAGAHAPFPFGDLRQRSGAVRARFQTQLLAWTKGRQPDFAAMRECVDELQALCHSMPARRLWWIAGGVLEALLQDRIDPHLASLRQQFGQIDRTIHRMHEHGEDACADTDARELTREMLFSLAHAAPEGGRGEAIIHCYDLDRMVPSESELERARAAMAGRTRSLLDTVAKAVREDLLRVKEDLDIFLRRQDRRPQQLARQVDALRRIGDTLGVLGFEPLAEMVEKQCAEIARIIDGELEGRPEEILDIASALLYVDTALDEHIDNLGAPVDSGEALPASEARKIMQALMREAGANLAQVREAMTAFIESAWTHARLADVPRLLAEVRGALQVLGLQRPAELVDTIDCFIGNELIVDRKIPTVDALDALADALAGVEYYIEIGRDAGTSDSRVLDRAQDSLAALHYWPPPGSRAPHATGDAPAAVAVVQVPAAVPDPADAAEASSAVDSPVAPGPERALRGDVPEVQPPADTAAGETTGSDASSADLRFQEIPGIDAEIREVFIEEVGETIANLNVGLPAWRSEPDNLDTLVEVRRAFHTLKGSGRLVGAAALGELSWKVENMLNRVLDHSIAPDANVVALVDVATVTLPKLHAALGGKAVTLEPPLAAIMEVADRLAAGHPARIADFAAGAGAGTAEPAGNGTPAGAAAPAPGEVPVDSVAVVAETGLPVIDPVLLDVLRTEVGQHLEQVRGYLARDAAHDAEVDDGLVRAVHTLHGAVVTVGIEPLAGLLAAAEAWVRRVHAAGAALDREGCDALRDAATITEHVMAQFDEAMPDLPDTTVLAERMDALRGRWPDPAARPPDRIAGADDGEGAVPEAADEQSSAEAEQRTAAEQAERERVAAERQAEQERIAAAEAEQRAAAERAERERVAAERRAEQERVASAEAERRAAAERKAEQQRLAAARAEQARIAAARAQAEREIAAAAFPPFPQDPQPDGDLEIADVDPELVALFTEEARELLDASDKLVARLRDAPGDPDAVHGLQRNLHTLKGAARVAGVAAVGDLAHAMETVLEQVGENGRALGALEVDSLERGFDRVQELVERVEQGRAVATPTNAIERFDALAEGRPVGDVPPAATPGVPSPSPRIVPLPERPEAPAATEMIRVRSDLLDALVNAAGEASIYRARLEQQIGDVRGNLVELEETVERLRGQLRKLEIETEAQILSRYQREDDAMAGADFDPLELDRFSSLQQYSRALAESVSDLAALRDMLEERTRRSETLLLQQSRVNADLQDGLMRTRMVPFESLVPGLRRTLRGAADELDKRAQLRVLGAQGEMDRSVLERMKAPFEHMLRNALAHGIEDPAQRVALGKPMEGTVSIQVGRQGTEVLVRFSDDGAGFDATAIRAKAIERGLLESDATPSDRELFAYVLQPGFSTAGEVSQLSGRGVGMDVVASEIRQLGGSLAIDSEPGRGTTFSIRLPFTLAVAQTIVVRAAETTFAVPMASLQAVSRIARTELVERLSRGETNVEYLGESYGLHDLSTLLGLGTTTLPADDQVPLLMVRADDLKAAIRIDAVVGSREIVIKPVGPQVTNVPGVFGATIRADGSVMLILDPAPMVRHLAAESADVSLALADAAGSQPAETVWPPLVMVVDDSITMRKATTRVLEREQLEVVTAKDGVDALEKLQDCVPDVMLLDIEMPRMDGYELATRMKNDPRLRDVPIIMITSRMGEKHRQRALEIGVDRYLGKPYSEADLLHDIIDMLEVDRA